MPSGKEFPAHLAGNLSLLQECWPMVRHIANPSMIQFVGGPGLVCPTTSQSRVTEVTLDPNCGVVSEASIFPPCSSQRSPSTHFLGCACLRRPPRGNLGEAAPLASACLRRRPPTHCCPVRLATTAGLPTITSSSIASCLPWLPFLRISNFLYRHDFRNPHPSSSSSRTLLATAGLFCYGISLASL